MEPTIKSEPCEAMYSEQDSNFQTLRDGIGSQPQNRLKRLYEEMEDCSATCENVNQSSQINSLCQIFELPSVPQHFQQNLKSQEVNQTQVKLDGKQLRKFKASVLFNQPFFNLVEELSNAGAISARCYGCGKVVKGNRGITSNFIKHMKRSHPETYKLYDDYKAQKTKSFYLPNHPEMIKKPATNPENGAYCSDSTNANSNDDTNQCFETRAVLEANILNESSDDNESSVNVIKEVVTTNGNFEISHRNLEILGRIIDEKLKSALDNANKVYDVGPKSEILELKTEISSLKKECKELRLAVQKSGASKRQLQSELQTVDKLLHERKLIIRNISVCDLENPLKSVETLFKEVMLLEDIKIAHCCIIPTAKTSKMSNKETVLIELNSAQDCRTILRQTQKLKNTGIFIEMETSPFQRKRKNKLLVLRKELLRRKPELKVLVRDTTIVVNGKTFYWDDVEGLCHDFKGDLTDLNGVEYLKTLSGLDLKEFIIFLLNYNVQTS